MALDLAAFDPAEYLEDVESLAAYLEDALDDGDAGEFLEALGVVARAKSMTEHAGDAGITHPAAVRHRDFAAVLGQLRSLGIRLHVSPVQPISAPLPRRSEAR